MGNKKLSLDVKVFKTINMDEEDEYDDVEMEVHIVDVEDGTIYIYVKDKEVEDGKRP